MKLIDEKIKALGLTKGQYCEKYGFKFKDFAAKVHTLEAKIEWANTFLKPLGLSAQILPQDSTEAVRFFLTERLSEQMDDESVRFLGSETPPEIKGLTFYDEIEKTVSMYNSIEGVSVQIGKEGTAGEYLDKGLGEGKLQPEDDAESLL